MFCITESLEIRCNIAGLHVAHPSLPTICLWQNASTASLHAMPSSSDKDIALTAFYACCMGWARCHCCLTCWCLTQRQNDVCARVCDALQEVHHKVQELVGATGAGAGTCLMSASAGTLHVCDMRCRSITPHWNIICCLAQTSSLHVSVWCKLV